MFCIILFVIEVIEGMAFPAFNGGLFLDLSWGDVSKILFAVLAGIKPCVLFLPRLTPIPNVVLRKNKCAECGHKNCLRVYF